MNNPDPSELGWWLASRAAGVVALLCIAVSVGIGLAMAAKLRPSWARTLLQVHQQTALVGLVAIAVHAVTLLGDSFLSPSIGDVTLPFTSSYEPLWTGLGVTGGWLAAILGLSYWIRDRIGPGLWRKAHRATILVYVLAVAHTLGAGTDASEPWILALLVATGAPILFLLVMRVLTPPAGPRYRPFRVVDVRPESSTVTSFELAPADRKCVADHEPGQFVSLRAGGGLPTRSYSLSTSPRPDRCRISVKREPGGRVSEHLHDTVAVGDVLQLGEPCGRFVLDDDDKRPIALISAGIGVTPVLAMLEALAERRSERAVWWIHGARNSDEQAFAEEARRHLARLPHARGHVAHSRPLSGDRLGRDHDAVGRLNAASVRALGVPANAEVCLCGPQDFVAELTADLVAGGVAPERIRSESFGGPRPAAVADGPAALHAGGAPTVAFRRSGVTTAWDSGFACLLDLAEARGVRPSFGCRAGSCHDCATAVLAGTVRHDPQPPDAPDPDSALLCCATPIGDVVLDV